MITLRQVKKEFERIGFEYAMGMVDDPFVQERYRELCVAQDSDPQNKGLVDELAFVIMSDGDAVGEIFFSEAGNYEWFERDGSVVFRNDAGEDAKTDCCIFEEDLWNGVRKCVVKMFLENS